MTSAAIYQRLVFGNKGTEFLSPEFQYVSSSAMQRLKSMKVSLRGDHLITQMPNLGPMMAAFLQNHSPLLSVCWPLLNTTTELRECFKDFIDTSLSRTCCSYALWTLRMFEISWKTFKSGMCVLNEEKLDSGSAVGRSIQVSETALLSFTKRRVRVDICSNLQGRLWLLPWCKWRFHNRFHLYEKNGSELRV